MSGSEKNLGILLILSPSLPFPTQRVPHLLIMDLFHCLYNIITLLHLLPACTCRSWKRHCIILVSLESNNPLQHEERVNQIRNLGAWLQLNEPVTHFKPLSRHHSCRHLGLSEKALESYPSNFLLRRMGLLTEWRGLRLTLRSWILMFASCSAWACCIPATIAWNEKSCAWCFN